MKKSQLRQLIREVIKENFYVKASDQPSGPGGQRNNPTKSINPTKISSAERSKLANAFHKFPELGGNKKLESLGQGLSIIHKCLDEFGFELDMVTGDMLLGQSGSRNLPYRRKDPNGNSREIENSRIAFSWTNLGDEFNKRYEIIAYPS
jgi:hypothetical protein